MLSAKRDAKAAERFFKKVLKAKHTKIPRVINVDKNLAYPPAMKKLKEAELLPTETELRQVKYLNNLIEQDHRFIKRRVNPGLGFGSFNTARRTIQGYEAMNMIRKGQIKNVEKYIKYYRHKEVSALFTAQHPLTKQVTRLSYRRVHTLWQELIDTDPLLKGIRLHDIRHSYATERVGLMSIEELRALMGHSNIQTTLRYQKVTSLKAEETAKKALNILVKNEEK